MPFNILHHLLCLQGYEVHVYDSVTNQTSYLGNTTETYFRISSLLLGHNYTFFVQARCLLNGQLCGEPALLLYNQLTAGTETHSRLRAQIWKKKNLGLLLHLLYVVCYFSSV